MHEPLRPPPISTADIRKDPLRQPLLIRLDMRAKANFQFLQQAHNLVKETSTIHRLSTSHLNFSQNLLYNFYVSVFIQRVSEMHGKHIWGPDPKKSEPAREVVAQQCTPNTTAFFNFLNPLLGCPAACLSLAKGSPCQGNNPVSTQCQVSSVAVFMNLMQQWSHSLDQILLTYSVSGKFSFHELCNRRAEADSSNTTFKSQDPKRKDLSNLTSVTISDIQNASAHTHCTIKNKIELHVRHLQMIPYL